ncbi:MAG: NrdH-redoxin [Rothia sp. (in: high G+C Gram-positive bacteria)]|nr:NrdH-redoxin [Rothia sp. (in: high G+C Gram-positive bacteria)]
MSIITVYTAPSCQQCRLTEARRAERRLTFRIIRLENEPAIATRLREQGFIQAPVVQVHGDKPQMWAGFRPDLFDALPHT